MKHDLEASAIHQWLADASHGARRRLSQKALHFASRALNGISDRPVSYETNGAKMLLPSSHPLPVYQRAFPDYDRALSRLVTCLRERRPAREFVVVDIGANVGDTATVLLAQPDVYVIAVDGNDDYLPYLRHNLAAFQNRASIADCFVGPPDSSGFSVLTEGGTARLVVGGGEEIRVRPLEDILRAAGRPRPDMIKIDTDGFDIVILDNAVELLKRLDSTLFFEFDPKLFAPNSPDGWGIFARLAAIGYVSGLLYRNTGQFLRSIDPRDEDHINELRAFIGSEGPTAYLDCALFKSPEDASLCRAAELDHFTR